MPKESTSCSASKGKNVVPSVEEEHPQLSPQHMALDDENAIERDYNNIKERATNPAKQDRRVSLPEFNRVGDGPDGNALFEDMNEHDFAALCRSDPVKV